MQSSEPPSSNPQQEDGQMSLEKEAWVHVDMKISTSEEIVGNTTQSQSLIRGYTLGGQELSEVGDTTKSQSLIRGYTLGGQEQSEVK